MKIKTKIWIDKSGELLFGTGKASILKLVEETGSINKAAKKLEMSYRHAWSYIRSIEERMGTNMLIRNKGGKGGGGAHLTQEAKELLKKYLRLEEDIKTYADQKFEEIFQKNGNV